MSSPIPPIIPISGLKNVVATDVTKSDYIPMVDREDGSQGASGSTVKAQVSQLTDWALPQDGRTVADLGQYLNNNKVFNVKDYGAAGDGITDDSAAVMAATNALVSSGGGCLLFPATPGNVYIVSGLNFDETVGAVIQGEGFPNDVTNSGVVLRTTSSGSDPLLTARSSQGFAVHNIRFEYTDPGYSGTLIDLRRSTGTDTSRYEFNNCSIGGTVSATGGVGVRLDGSHTGVFRTCRFRYSQYHVIGVETTHEYANGITFDTCFMGYSIQKHVKDVGRAWVFINPVIQERVGGSAGWIGDADPAISPLPIGLTIIGGWVGDITSGTEPQIEYVGHELYIAGTFMGVGAGTGIRLVGESQRGIFIHGRFSGDGSPTSTAVDLGTPAFPHASVDVQITSGGVVNSVVGNRPRGSIIFDSQLQIAGNFEVGSDPTLSIATPGTGRAVVYARHNGDANEFGVRLPDGSLYPLATQGKGVILPNGRTVQSFTSGGAARDILYITSSDQVFVGAPTSDAMPLFLRSNATTATGSMQINGNVGFYGTSPGTKPTVTGSWSDGSAGVSLAAALATLGLITDSTTS